MRMLIKKRRRKMNRRRRLLEVKNEKAKLNQIDILLKRTRMISR